MPRLLWKNLKRSRYNIGYPLFLPLSLTDYPRSALFLRSSPSMMFREGSCSRFRCSSVIFSCWQSCRWLPWILFCLRSDHPCTGHFRLHISSPLSSHWVSARCCLEESLVSTSLGTLLIALSMCTVVLNLIARVPVRPVATSHAWKLYKYFVLPNCRSNNPTLRR